MSIKKIILVKKTMDHLEDENYQVKRPTFLTVLCILTFIGSGWAIFSAITAYNTAERTIGVFTDSIMSSKEITRAKNDTLIMEPKTDTFAVGDSLKDSVAGNDSLEVDDDNLNENGVDTTSASYQMGKSLGAKLKDNVMDMLTVDKMKHSAIGSFIAALFTIAGAFFMFRLRKPGFYLYIIGIAIGIAVPFYIYSGNLLAIGLASFSSFFGLIFIALYALNLKSMK